MTIESKFLQHFTLGIGNHAFMKNLHRTGFAEGVSRQRTGCILLGDSRGFADEIYLNMTDVEWTLAVGRTGLIQEVME